MTRSEAPMTPAMPDPPSARPESAEVQPARAGNRAGRPGRGAWVLLLALALTLAIVVEVAVVGRKVLYPFNSGFLSLWDMKLFATSIQSLTHNIYGYSAGGLCYPFVYTPLFFVASGAVAKPFWWILETQGLGYYYVIWALFSLLGTGAVAWSMYRCADSRESVLLGLLLMFGLTYFSPHSAWGTLLDGDPEFMAGAFVVLAGTQWIRRRRLTPGVAGCVIAAILCKQVALPYLLTSALLVTPGGLGARLKAVAGVAALAGASLLGLVAVYGPASLDSLLIVPGRHPVGFVPTILGLEPWMVRKFMESTLTSPGKGFVLAYGIAFVMLALRARRYAWLIWFSGNLTWGFYTAYKVGSHIDKVFLPIYLSLPFACQLLYSDGARLTRIVRTALGLYVAGVVCVEAPRHWRVMRAEFTPERHGAYRSLIAEYRGQAVAFPEQALLSLLTENPWVDDGYGVFDHRLAGYPLPPWTYANIREFEWVASAFPDYFQQANALGDCVATFDRIFGSRVRYRNEIFLWKRKAGLEPVPDDGRNRDPR